MSFKDHVVQERDMLRPARQAPRGPQRVRGPGAQEGFLLRGFGGGFWGGGRGSLWLAAPSRLGGFKVQPKNTHRAPKTLGLRVSQLLVSRSCV